MLTPLSVSKVNLTLQNQKRKLTTYFPEHNRTKRASNFSTLKFNKVKE